MSIYTTVPTGCLLVLEPALKLLIPGKTQELDDVEARRLRRVGIDFNDEEFVDPDKRGRSQDELNRQTHKARHG